MKNSILVVTMVCFILSCRDTENDISEITTTDAKGTQVVSEDELSVEDIEKLQNASDVPTQSYTAILTNDIEKPYFINSDSGQTVTCLLKTSSTNVTLTLYKEGMKTVKLDSMTSSKVKDYIKISEGDSCANFAKKPTKYKAIVKLKRKFVTGDSTAEFTLNLFKK